MRVVPMLHDQTVKQANLVATIKVYLQTQIPYTYTHLMTIIVKVHLLFVTAVAGTFVGQGIHDKQYITVVWGYLIILLSNTVFEGLLRIHVVLADPFGADACDFPMEMYNDYLWHESNHVLDLLNEGGMPQMPIELLDIDEILAPKRGDKDDVMDD